MSLNDRVLWGKLSRDERRKTLSKKHNDKKKSLDDAKAAKGRLDIEKQQGDPVDENEVADLDRDIVVFGSEELLLDRTLKIYDLIYKPVKTPDDKQKLTNLWNELENHPSKPEKMRDYLDDLWNQLKLDSGYNGKLAGQ